MSSLPLIESVGEKEKSKKTIKKIEMDGKIRKHGRTGKYHEKIPNQLAEMVRII